MAASTDQPDSRFPDSQMPHPTPPSGGPQPPDDALPKVHPPGAGFIVQLFVYPLVIVGGIVCVALLFNWLVSAPRDPHSCVADLENPGTNRFRAAYDLAAALRDRRNDEFRKDGRQARRVATVLRTEIDRGGMDDSSISLRTVLCKALGEFHVPDGLDALMLAATTRRVKQEIYVQRDALEAIATLAEHVRESAPLDSPELLRVLLDASQDSQYVIQERAAYALGTVGGEEAIARLVNMLDTAMHPNVRYNAATALARHGRTEIIPVLGEMLDPDNEAGLADEQKESLGTKRAGILKSAIQGTVKLSENNPQADLGMLVEGIGRLRDFDFDDRMSSQSAKNVRDLAQWAMEKLTGP